MTQNQISLFLGKKSLAKEFEIKAGMLLAQAKKLSEESIALCDHRYEDETIAGPEFQGSYCGFICQICQCSVSYEKMGH